MRDIYLQCGIIEGIFMQLGFVRKAAQKAFSQSSLLKVTLTTAFCVLIKKHGRPLCSFHSVHEIHKGGEF